MPGSAITTRASHLGGGVRNTKMRCARLSRFDIQDRDFGRHVLGRLLRDVEVDRVVGGRDLLVSLTAERYWPGAHACTASYTVREMPIAMSYLTASPPSVV